MYSEGYVIVSEEIEVEEGKTETVYYCVYTVTGKKIKLDTSKDNWTFVSADETGYQIAYTVTNDDGSTETFYEIYNPLGKLVLKADSMLYYAGDTVMEEEGWLIVWYVTDNYTYYIVE